MLFILIHLYWRFPAEERVSDTSGEDYRIKSLNADNYTVEVEPYGIGTLTVTDGNAVLKGGLR